MVLTGLGVRVKVCECDATPPQQGQGIAHQQLCWAALSASATGADGVQEGWGCKPYVVQPPAMVLHSHTAEHDRKSQHPMGTAARFSALAIQRALPCTCALSRHNTTSLGKNDKPSCRSTALRPFWLACKQRPSCGN